VFVVVSRFFAVLGGQVLPKPDGYLINRHDRDYYAVLTKPYSESIEKIEGVIYD